MAYGHSVQTNLRRRSWRSCSYLLILSASLPTPCPAAVRDSRVELPDPALLIIDQLSESREPHLYAAALARGLPFTATSTMPPLGSSPRVHPTPLPAWWLTPKTPSGWAAPRRTPYRRQEILEAYALGDRAVRQRDGEGVRLSRGPRRNPGPAGRKSPAVFERGSHEGLVHLRGPPGDTRGLCRSGKPQQGIPTYSRSPA